MTPEQTTVIRITHVDQTDTEAGEYFGATLYTYKRPSGDQFEYQHLLKNIKILYPARIMQICEDDELGMIGDTFTSDLDHTEVLNCFLHYVKEDGKSRFCLVLRKSENGFWYETSAILTPNPSSEHDAVPKVTYPEYGPATPKCSEKKIIFSIQGTTAYMFIDQTGIQGKAMTDPPFYVNLTKNISFSDRPAFSAALSGMDGISYLRIDANRNIVISDKSNCTFFGYIRKGHDYEFHDDVFFFLSYDTMTKCFAMTNINEEGKSIIYIDVGRPRSFLCVDHLGIDPSMMEGNNQEGVKMRRVRCLLF